MVKVEKFTKKKKEAASQAYQGEMAREEYGVWKNTKYFLGLVWENCKGVIPMGLALVACQLVIPLCTNYRQKYIVEFILGTSGREGLAIVIISLFMAGGLALFLNEHINFMKSHVVYFQFRNYLSDCLQKKCMTTDYENVEHAKNGDRFQKANSANDWISGDMLGVLERAVTALLGIAAFGSIMAALTPVIVILAAFPAVAGYYINRHKMRWIWNMADNWQTFERQLEYIVNAGSEFGHAKDVRLFGMQHWFSDIYKRSFTKRLGWYEQQDAWERRHDIFANCVQGFGKFAVYGYIIYKVMQGRVGAGDFVLYMSSVNGLSYYVREWCDKFSDIQWFSKNVGWLRQYGEMKDKERDYVPEEGMAQEYEIEFCNVAYTYNGADEPTIKNLSFTLHKGERLAIVGLNGAGKTTVVKLMCGLYDPTEGEIRLNGIPVSQYPRRQYFRLFSTVFQDTPVLPVSIAENIAGGLAADKGRVADCLKKAGLYDKVQALPEKEDTRLVKSVYDNAVDLSGGQLQKLALAKALYKDAPVLLLDEPTAALDAIAEQEMYLNYASFSKAKCSLFISHRLASTRFCDRILYLEHGQVVEEGTHAALLCAGGKYAKLYRIQSSYYNDDGI